MRPYDSKRPEVERMHTQEESTNDCIDAYKEFHTMVLDIQADYSDEKARAIDQKIFDLYGLTPAEREAIGYIDFHNNNDNEPDGDE